MKSCHFGITPLIEVYLIVRRSPRAIRWKLLSSSLRGAFLGFGEEGIEGGLHLGECLAKIFDGIDFLAVATAIAPAPLLPYEVLSPFCMLNKQLNQRSIFLFPLPLKVQFDSPLPGSIDAVFIVYILVASLNHDLDIATCLPRFRRTMCVDSALWECASECL